MEDDLVILGERMGLSRYDTTVEGISALHGRFPMPGCKIDNRASQLELIFDVPEHYDDTFPITSTDIEKLAEKKYVSFNDEGRNYRELIGTPVRIYYLHHQIAGWELR